MEVWWLFERYGFFGGSKYRTSGGGPGGLGYNMAMYGKSSIFLIGNTSTDSWWIFQLAMLVFFGGSSDTGNSDESTWSCCPKFFRKMTYT